MQASRIASIALSSIALALSLTAGAATSASSNAARWSFDGAIHNNSLALSPDQATAVASYSESPDVVVYDLASHKVRATLHGFVTPRNVVFDPTGKSFYVSDSSLGLVRKIDTATLQDVADLPAGAGAFGTTLSRDGSTLYVNNEAANTVTSFDLKTNRPVSVTTGFSQPRQGVRLNPEGDTLFVTNFLGDKITPSRSRTTARPCLPPTAAATRLPWSILPSA
jgi:DNA-binding beta-propeller fold protein YncE